MLAGFQVYGFQVSIGGRFWPSTEASRHSSEQ